MWILIDTFFVQQTLLWTQYVLLRSIANRLHSFPMLILCMISTAKYLSMLELKFTCKLILMRILWCYENWMRMTRKSAAKRYFVDIYEHMSMYIRIYIYILYTYIQRWAATPAPIRKIETQRSTVQVRDNRHQFFHTTQSYFTKPG